MKHIKITLSFMMLLTFAVNAFSQGTWTTYTDIKEIREIAIYGDYLWCATADGLVQLDTRTMDKYTASEGLPNNNVFSLAIDDGVVWIGTSEGLSRYEENTWKTYTVENGLLYNSVRSIAVNYDGDVWVSTVRKIPLAGGVCRYNGENWEIYTRDDGLKSDCVYSIACGEDGAIWFGTCLGVARYDGEDWKTYTAASGRLPHNYVYSSQVLKVL